MRPGNIQSCIDRLRGPWLLHFCIAYWPNRRPRRSTGDAPDAHDGFARPIGGGGGGLFLAVQPRNVPGTRTNWLRDRGRPIDRGCCGERNYCGSEEQVNLAVVALAVTRGGGHCQP